MAKIEPKQRQTKSGKPLIIRTARAKDSQQVLVLSKSVMAEGDFNLTESDELDWTIEQETHWILDHFDHPSKIVLLAEIDSAIVGMISFSCGHRKRISHRGEFGMCVAEASRGQGIGQALIEELLDWAAKSQFVEKVCLSVTTNNERAIKLYRKLQFIEEGRQYRDLKLGPGRYTDSIQMYRWVK